jgi:hypothetical protein
MCGVWFVWFGNKIIFFYDRAMAVTEDTVHAEILGRSFIRSSLQIRDAEIRKLETRW